MIEPSEKDKEVRDSKAKGFPGEDLFAVSALWIVVLIAIGIASHGVNATLGSAIIAALAGAAGIAKFIELRRRGSEKTR